MSRAWTEDLCAPLASLLRERDCRRIEKGRHGEWVVLTGSGEWLRVRGDQLSPLSWREDSRLGLVALTERWAAEGIRWRMLAHRPGRRVALLLEGPRGRRVAKVYAKDRGQEQRWRAVTGDEAFEVPGILDFDARTRVLTMEFRRGTSLHQRWREGTAGTEEARAAAAVLDRLHTHPAPTGLPVHSMTEEAQALQAQAQLVRVLFPVLPAEFERVLEQTLEVLAAEAEAPSVVGHRDLHDKQILLGAARPILLDLDLVAIVPPGLDAGNLLAHARLRRMQGARLDFAGFAGALRAAGKASWRQEDRLRPWIAASLCRLSFVYARRHGGLEFGRRLAAEARAALEGRDPFDGRSRCEAR